MHTAGLKDGAPLKGHRPARARRQGEVVLKGSTDGNGNALLNYTLDATHVLVASSGKDTSFLPFNQPALDLSEFAVAGRDNAWFDVYAWSAATCTARARPCACPRCCATTTASRSRRSRCSCA